MTTLADSGEGTQPSSTDMPWLTLSSEQAMPVMSVSMPAFLLGMHVIQGVLANFQLPTFIQTISKDRPNGQGDRMFTFPPSVINGDDFKRFTPRKRHLKPKKLLKRLGNEFDAFWMSTDLPDDLLETHVKQTLDISMHEQLSNVNLTALEYTLQAKFSGGDGGHGIGGGDSNQVTSGILDLVKSWLVQTSSCPVYYRWEDLGLLYWPRWVRRGMCSLKDTPLFKLTSESASKIPKFSSCSWPPGMHCVPGDAKRLKILRWQCRHNKALNNFNRFQMPGMITPRNLPTKSHQEPKNIQPPISNQHLMKHQMEDHNVTRNHFEHLKRQLGAEERQARSRRNTLRSPQLKITDPMKSSQAKGDQSGDREKHSNPKTHSIFPEKWQGIPGIPPDGISDGIPDGTQHSEDSYKRRGEVKGHKHSDDKKQEPDGNDTENWNSMSWKQRRRALDLKCKWIKIPYPVTDNCFCSC